MRLQKFLARCGVASRRASEKLIASGRVSVNGVVVTGLAERIDPAVDLVEVDGRAVSRDESFVYIMLNKPAGYITSMGDPFDRPTVSDLVPDDFAGLFPVGRLDKETTGALLFTNNGELGFRLLHPKYHVQKVYEVRVKYPVTDDQVRKLTEGIELDDGLTLPAKTVLLDEAKDKTLVHLTITEGRKRQVRRMFAAISNPVLLLHRVSFGPLSLGDLASGHWRHLTDAEIESLLRIGDDS
ncbi:MAG: rRNA pseudouridine synthase [Actinobacteria bacterium]|nr:rRNA pseudouridine synthase [Actinomycetota bacterium]